MVVHYKTVWKETTQHFIRNNSFDTRYCKHITMMDLAQGRR
jgi:hypothetical protein